MIFDNNMPARRDDTALLATHAGGYINGETGYAEP